MNSRTVSSQTMCLSYPFKWIDIVQVVAYERPALSKAYLFPEGNFPAHRATPLFGLQKIFFLEWVRGCVEQSISSKQAVWKGILFQ